MPDAAALLADHYQKTYELTLSMWEQRNRTFLLLLGVVGVAALLTFQLAVAEPLLVGAVAKLAGTPEGQYAELRRSFPYGLVQTILLMVVLYLMVILYHRTRFLKRCYHYLSVLEDELRKMLSLPPDSRAFTRESGFYLAHESTAGRWIGHAHKAMLGLLLLVFLGNRIAADWALGETVIAVVDVALAVVTLGFFVAYAKSA